MSPHNGFIPGIRVIIRRALFEDQRGSQPPCGNPILETYVLFSSIVRRIYAFRTINLDGVFVAIDSICHGVR